jgi:Flp pilus assembly pilin Flp
VELARRAQALLADETAGTLVEYALLLALIAIAAVVAMHKLGTKVTNEFTSASTDFTKAKKHL